MALRLLIILFVFSISLWIVFSLDIIILCIILNCVSITGLLAIYYEYCSEEEIEKDWENYRAQKMKELFDEKNKK